MKNRYILTLLLVFQLPAVISAYNFEVDGIYYNLNGESVTVTYKDFGNNSYSGNVTIPESVTHNGITYSVISIGDDAFFDCKGLTGVSVPNSVESIGSNAFSNCSSLSFLYLGESVSSIGSLAFSGCSGLTSVTIPKSVTYIGSLAFAGCNALDTVNYNAISCADFPFHKYELDIYHPFYQLNIKTINIGDCVQRIPAYFAYGQTMLTNMNLDLPNSIIEIGEGAFFYCQGLTGCLTIPNSVTSIPSYAFCACSGLASVVLPNSVTSIGKYAFDGCSSLLGVYITDIESWCKTSFESPGANPLYCAKHLYLNDVEVTNLIIPSSILTISNEAFAGCIDLQSVTIPNSVTTVGNYAFEDCFNLTNLIIGNSVVHIGDYAFSGCNKLSDILCQAITPPTANYNYLPFSRYDATLKVPSSSVQDYKKNQPWKRFTNILGINAGDVNCDGKENISDVTALIDILLKDVEPLFSFSADVNGDGIINISDATALIGELLEGD